MCGQSIRRVICQVHNNDPHGMNKHSPIFEPLVEGTIELRGSIVIFDELSVHETCLASFSMGLPCCPLTVFGTILDHPDKGWSSSLYYGFKELLTCIDHIV